MHQTLALKKWTCLVNYLWNWEGRNLAHLLLLYHHLNMNVVRISHRMTTICQRRQRYPIQYFHYYIRNKDLTNGKLLIFCGFMVFVMFFVQNKGFLNFLFSITCVLYNTNYTSTYLVCYYGFLGIDAYWLEIFLLTVSNTNMHQGGSVKKSHLIYIHHKDTRILYSLTIGQLVRYLNWLAGY